MTSRVRFTELQLLLVPGLLTVVGLLSIYLASTRDLNWDWRDIWVSLAYVGAVLGLSIWFGIARLRGDQVLFPLVVCLAGLGLLMVQRLAPDLVSEEIYTRELQGLSSESPSYASLARNQLVYLALGLSLLLATITMLRQLDWLKRYKYTWALLAIFVMAVTAVVGTEINGARLWLDVGPFTIQTSEIAKLALVVFLAAYLAERRDLITQNVHIGPIPVPPLPYLAPMGIMWGMSLLVLVRQNDFGTALLFFCIFISMLYVATNRLSYVLLLVGLFVVSVYAVSQISPRVVARADAWLNPWADPNVSGYQLVQSEYALATGGVFGTGLAQGHPAFIPEVHSDFVFSAIGEELGLAGTLVVLLLFVLLTFRGLSIAAACWDPFAKFLATGLTVALGAQALIIVGGTVRLIPLTGITLPFVSAGGSSLLSNFIIVGLLMRISHLNATGT